jgi:hypothetical protein
MFTQSTDPLLQNIRPVRTWDETNGGVDNQYMLCSNQTTTRYNTTSTMPLLVLRIAYTGNTPTGCPTTDNIITGLLGGHCHRDKVIGDQSVNAALCNILAQLGVLSSHKHAHCFTTSATGHQAANFIAKVTAGNATKVLSRKAGVKPITKALWVGQR